MNTIQARKNFLDCNIRYYKTKLIEEVNYKTNLGNRYHIIHRLIETSRELGLLANDMDKKILNKRSLSYLMLNLIKVRNDLNDLISLKRVKRAKKADLIDKLVYWSILLGVGNYPYNF